MKTVRLGNELEQRLEEAARVTGEPASRIIREAVRERCDELLGDRLQDRISDVIGSVTSKGGQSRQTGRDFTNLLTRRKRKRKPRR